jgi:uncharacterized membrane protein
MSNESGIGMSAGQESRSQVPGAQQRLASAGTGAPSSLLVVPLSRLAAVGREAHSLLAFTGLAGLAVAGFALAPGTLAMKAHMALHGLCAQRPAHTFALGDTLLPFDARMTGIYLGVLIAGLPLVLLRRRGTIIQWPWLALLAGWVVVMGLDGLNSLRVDLGLPAWWAPDNRLRLATGLLAGLSLGVALVWLLNVSLWPAGGMYASSLLRGRDAVIWLVGAAMAGGVVLSGVGWALVPVTLLLMAGAVVALLALNLAFLSMALNGATGAPSGWRKTATPAMAGWRALAGPATLALVLALAEMALLAGGRYALEAMVGRGIM